MYVFTQRVEDIVLTMYIWDSLSLCLFHYEQHSSEMV